MSPLEVVTKEHVWPLPLRFLDWITNTKEVELTLSRYVWSDKLEVIINTQHSENLTMSLDQPLRGL